jgi:hypothetical protein
MVRASRASVTLLVSVFLAGFAASDAFAISADLAKKCREMAIKTHPPVRAGTAKGTAGAQREYFQNCIANEGKDDAPAAAPPATPPSSGR